MQLTNIHPWTSKSVKQTSLFPLCCLHRFFVTVTNSGLTYGLSTLTHTFTKTIETGVQIYSEVYVPLYKGKSSYSKGSNEFQISTFSRHTRNFNYFSHIQCFCMLLILPFKFSNPHSRCWKVSEIWINSICLVYLSSQHQGRKWTDL